MNYTEWEYLVEKLSLESYGNAHLDYFGKDGWELVSVIYRKGMIYMTFKRPLSEEASHDG